MKFTKYFRKTMFPMGISLGTLILTGCGQETENPGINLGTDQSVDRIYFEDVENVKFRVENEGTSDEVLVPYYYLSGKIADTFVPFLTAPITGIGSKDRVDVSILSVASVKGTTLDPDLFDQKVENDLNLERCLARNDAAIGDSRETEICTQQQAVEACEADYNNALDPTKPCDEQPDPYGIVYIEPTAIDAEGVFQYQVVAATDEFGKYIDITNDELKIHDIYENGEVVGQESDYTTNNVTLGQNSQLRLKFDLPDEPFYWDNQFQAVMQVGDQKFDVMFDTNPRIPEINDPASKFKNLNYTNVSPGTILTTPVISFEGHNTRAPVQLLKTEDFSLEYSVDGGEFVQMVGNETPLGSCDTEGVICVRGGGIIQLRITTEKETEVSVTDPAFERNYNVTVKIGEGLITEGDPAPNTLFVNTVYLKTHAWDYVPGTERTLQFPNRSSMTMAESISIRGQFSVTQAMKDYTHEDIVSIPEDDIIRPTKATLYRLDANGANDTTWTPLVINYATTGVLDNNIVIDSTNSDVFNFQFKPVPLALNERSKFYVVTESNVSRVTDGNTFIGKSEPLFVDVEQRSTLPVNSTFPDAASTSMLKNMRDASIHPTNGLIYITDQTSNEADASGSGGNYGLIWRYSLDAESSPSCTVRPISVKFSEDRLVGGIQFNHARPELGGAIIKNGQGPIYLSEEQLHLGPTATYNLVINKTDWLGNAGREARMYSWDYEGGWIYSNSHNRVYNNTGAGQQQFINAMSFNTTTAVVDGEEIETVVSMQRLGANGKVSQEITGSDGVNHNGIALDIMTIEKGTDQEGKRIAEEWILSLDMKNDDFYYRRNGVGVSNTMGEMNLTKVKVSHETTPDYSNPLTNWTTLELLYNGEVLTISDGHAIVIDDKRAKAYIVDNLIGRIYEVDISNIATANSLVVTRILVDNTTSPIPFTQIESLVMEGDIDYLVAIDSKQNSLYAIDPISGDMTFVLKTLGTKSDANKSVCEQ